MGTAGCCFTGFGCNAADLGWEDTFGGRLGVSSVVHEGGTGASFGGNAGTTLFGDVTGLGAFEGGVGGAPFDIFGGKECVSSFSFSFGGNIGKANCFTGNVGGDSFVLRTTVGDRKCGGEKGLFFFAWFTEES